MIRLMKGMPEWWNQITTRVMSAAGVVNSGPTLLLGVILVGDGTADTNTLIYDGVSADGRLRFRLGNGTKEGAPIMFAHPVPFPQGLYWTTGDHVDYANFVYIPLRD